MSEKGCGKEYFAGITKNSNEVRLICGEKKIVECEEWKGLCPECQEKEKGKGLKVIDGTPTAISDYLIKREIE